MGCPRAKATRMPPPAQPQPHHHSRPVAKPQPPAVGCARCGVAGRGCWRGAGLVAEALASEPWRSQPRPTCSAGAPLQAPPAPGAPAPSGWQGARARARRPAAYTLLELQGHVRRVHQWQILDRRPLRWPPPASELPRHGASSPRAAAQRSHPRRPRRGRRGPDSQQQRSAGQRPRETGRSAEG